MKKDIILHRKKISYTIKVNQRAKNLRLAIYGDKGLVVIAPKGIKLKQVEEFILRKSRWIIKKLEYFKKFGYQNFLKVTRGDYAKYKKHALALAQERVKYFNKFYGFKVNKITVKNQKTRWGSCSKKGNLNFNYKIALLPIILADYIIIHELCHLDQFNHSRKFWDLVSKTIPDFFARRKKIKKTFLIR